MKICFIIVFITCGIQTFHVGTSYKYNEKFHNSLNALHAIHKNTFLNCQKFLCPSVDAPLCVKLKFRDNRTNVIVRLMNKCEEKYVKCTQGAKAVTIPMVRCDEQHTLGNKAGKRALDPSDAKWYPGTWISLTRDGKINDALPTQGLDNIRRKRSPLKKFSDNVMEGFNPIDFTEKPKTTKKLKLKKITVTTVKAVFDESLSAACPKMCPGPTHRMVCAKCSHSIYRSFLSVCHLRMYQCRRPPNEIEPLELVSRDSCIFSAPYMDNKPFAPNNLLNDYELSDPTVWYDYCRKKNLLGKHPKCIFR